MKIYNIYKIFALLDTTASNKSKLFFGSIVISSKKYHCLSELELLGEMVSEEMFKYEFCTC